MKFGVRECANITFKALSDRYIGNKLFKKNQPVLYIDSAKTSTLEGASTTVYAQGGRGNTRLIAWEGEKTLTFTVEDALLSPISLAMLTGAGLFSIEKEGENAYVHMTTQTTLSKDTDGTIHVDLSDALGLGEEIADDTNHTLIFVGLADQDGSITGEFLTVGEVTSTAATSSANGSHIIEVSKSADEGATEIKEGLPVFVDYYITKKKADVTELQIDAEHFAGSYYVEADTLFRRQHDSVDLPATITLPNVKIQSNFSFAMSGTGDPSTFTFTMDAVPGYTYFDKSKKVLCVMQILDASEATATVGNSVMMPETAGSEA